MSSLGRGCVSKLFFLFCIIDAQAHCTPLQLSPSVTVSVAELTWSLPLSSRRLSYTSRGGQKGPKSYSLIVSIRALHAVSLVLHCHTVNPSMSPPRPRAHDIQYTRISGTSLFSTRHYISLFHIIPQRSDPLYRDYRKADSSDEA